MTDAEIEGLLDWLSGKDIPESLLSRQCVTRPIALLDAARDTIRSLLSRAQTAERQRDEAREALKPFAKAFDAIAQDPKAAQCRRDWNEKMPGHWPIELTVTMDDGRRARALTGGN